MTHNEVFRAELSEALDSLKGAITERIAHNKREREKEQLQVASTMPVQGGVLTLSDETLGQSGLVSRAREHRARENTKDESVSTNSRLESGDGNFDRTPEQIERRGYLAQLKARYRTRLENSRLYSIFQKILVMLHR